METKLLYMEYMGKLSCSAQVIDIRDKDGKTVIILDQTVFYPQGGGQPYDTGRIRGASGIFNVEEVRYSEGLVEHIGLYESGELKREESVECVVDTERRTLNTRLHSAGHVIDMALKELSIAWKPGKGYHFPNGPYVEYQGSLEGCRADELKASLEGKCNEIIARSIETRLVFDNTKLQNGKPMRTVYYGDFGIPCGGTHASNLKDIGSITIRKIKQEKENVKISYI